MKRQCTLLALFTFLLCLNTQASAPSLMENFNNGKVLTETHHTITDMMNSGELHQFSLKDKLKVGGDWQPRPVDAFVFGLAAGMNLYGFAFGFDVFTGNSKFGDQDKVKGPAQIGLNTSLFYQRMLCHSFALGAFLTYAATVDLERDDDYDEKNVQNYFLIGLLATYYWGFGNLNRGGVLASYSLGAGFYGDKNRFDGESDKGPKTAVLQNQIKMGGWVQPTPCLMFFAMLGVMSYEVQFQKSSSDVKFRSHDFGFDLATWSPTIGLNFICGGGEGHMESRRRSSKGAQAFVY